MNAEWLPNLPLTTLKRPGNTLSRLRVIIGWYLEPNLTLCIPIVIPSVNERKSLDGRLWSSRTKPQLCQVPTSFPRGPRSTYNWKIRSRPNTPAVSGLQSRKCVETSQRDVGRDVVASVDLVVGSFWSQAAPVPAASEVSAPSQINLELENQIESACIGYLWLPEQKIRRNRVPVVISFSLI